RTRRPFLRADHPPAAANNFLKGLDAPGRALVPISRPASPPPPAAAAASAAPTTAAACTRHRHPRIVCQHDHVGPVGERSPEVLWMERDESEAILLEHPSRPSFVDARGPRLVHSDAGPAHGHAAPAPALGLWGGAVGWAWGARERTISMTADSGSPSRMYRDPAPPDAGTHCTLAPHCHARASARKALFCAGSRPIRVPAPVRVPSGGTMAAAVE